MQHNFLKLEFKRMVKEMTIERNALIKINLERPSSEVEKRISELESKISYVEDQIKYF